MNNQVRVLWQEVVGYNFEPDYNESIVASCWLLEDGSSEVEYTGYRTDRISRMEYIHPYGKICPSVQRPK